MIIYPKAGILRDVHITPLGKMSGGLLQLNGVADILTQRFIKDTNILLFAFLIFSFIATYYILTHYGLISGILFTLGVLIFDFWGLVLLGLKGLKFNYPLVVFFVLLFFLLGNLYKYIYFFA